MLPTHVIRLIKEDVHKVLTEGGLYGHMSHLYEDSSLSFREMKEVFDLATKGKLENVTEKTDGQNIFFSYNLAADGLRFARNQGHVRTGGMSAQDIVDKWHNIPHIQKAYHTAYIVLDKAIKSLATENKKKIFGANANIWYSAEVIYTGAPNVINYDNNTLAIHESGTVYNDQGKPMEDVDTRENFAVLLAAVKRMQKAVSSTGWTIMGPVVLELKRATQGNPGKEASAALSSEIGKYGLSDSNTVGDYIAKKFTAYAKSYVPDISNEEASQMGQIFADDSLTGGQKKKAALIVHKSKEVENLFLAKNASKILKKMIYLLEMIIHDFAVDILDGVQSVIALHPAKEVKRLRQAVGEEIEKIRATEDERALEVLGQQLEKLRSIDKITSSVEGIVFTYKGKTFKLTGSFAPINQLMGILKYKRTP